MLAPGQSAPDVVAPDATVLPGLVDAHSHAFQRAFVGLGRANHVAFVDVATRKVIEHGRRIRACLKQPEFDPVSVPAQITILVALTAGLFDPVPIDKVTDAEITQAYLFLGSHEGVFCEPASAASVAGVAKLHRSKVLREGDTVVCTLTGHGLKDADTAIGVSRPPLTVKATREDVARLLQI